MSLPGTEKLYSEAQRESNEKDAEPGATRRFERVGNGVQERG